MAEYNRTSLINIATANYEVLKGAVSKENYSIELNPNSACRFSLEYLFSKDNLKTNSFCIRYSVNNEDASVISRHKAKVKINIHIQYYKEDNSGTVTSYVAGPFSTYQTYPYFNNERDGFINEVCPNIDNQLIKKLYIDFINESENTVVFTGFSIYKEQTTTDIVQDVLGGLGIDKIWKSMDGYEDQIVAYHTKGNNPITFFVTESEVSNVYKINISDVYSFYIALHNGKGPYRGSDK